MRAALLIATMASAACSSPTDLVVVNPSDDVVSMRLASPTVTPAEASDYRATASYPETVRFLGALVTNPAFSTRSFGTTVEGREMPLVVWGADGATPESAHATGKTRVLVIGGIHSGEPAGKDAMLALLRDLAAGEHAAWADSLVLTIAPIYNADGAEKRAYDNRPLQWGPTAGTGTRANADGLDLNRDFVKAASPEAQAMVALIRDLDPNVVLDLHTTNGTAMGYDLTYAPGLHPDTPDGVSSHLYDRWLPAITSRLMAEDDIATYHYGNVPGAFGEPATAPRGWYSFSAQPRFSTNYVGLRGRYAILSEAYSYASFEDRVTASRRFVEEVLDQAWTEASHVRQVTDIADGVSVVGDTVAVRATWDALPDPVEILLGQVDTLAHPVTGEPMRARRDVRIPETMPAFVRFAASETTVAPEAYLVTDGPHQDAVRALLDLHGVRYRQERVSGVPTERFYVDSLRVADRLSQGVRMQDAVGRWLPAVPSPEPVSNGLPLVVPVGQPLGRLVVTLLDPRSDDGVIAWNVMTLEGGAFAPIERIPAR